MRPSTGTLMWIGPRDTAETRRPFAYCQQHASQLALRDNLADALDRPADAVTHILAARIERTAAAQSELDAIEQHYTAARRTVLVGSNVEGEARTGYPWSGWQRLRWHAWNQVLPEWFSPSPAPPGDAAGLTVVVAASERDAAPMRDVLEDWSVASLWQRPTDLAAVRWVQRVIWDDSAAAATSAAGWQQRLQSIHQAPHARHAWAVNFPRVHELETARRGGIDLLLSKPYLRAPLLRFLSSSTLPS